MPQSLKELRLGEKFNRPLTLPESLEILYLGNKFNQSITLPQSLKKLTLGHNFNQFITCSGRTYEMTESYPQKLKIFMFKHQTKLISGNLNTEIEYMD